MSSTSYNQNNTGSLDAQYLSQLTDGDVTPYWVPSSSKLSRGVKGTIQRVFTGEPLKNSCNVYIYNETTKNWYHEHTILGDPSRSGDKLYPGQILTGNSNQTFNGITYTTSASINTVGGGFGGQLGGGAFTGFGSSNVSLSWNSSNFVNGINTPTYPHYEPSGWSGSGTWVEGTYIGSNSLGGVSGEWLKLQLSSALQPDKVSLESAHDGGAWRNPNNITILGSNDDSTWTNLGNWTLGGVNFAGEVLFNNLTLSTSYTYFGFVFTHRYTSYAFRNVGSNDTYLKIQGLKLYNQYPSVDFGRSLDGTDNADMVAIGAPGTWFGSVSTITGYAYVFTKNSSGNGWTQRGSEVSQQGGFGHSVALSPYDGNILVVGAPFYNSLTPYNNSYTGDTRFRTAVSEGKVYIYKWGGTNYTLQQTLNSPSGPMYTSPLFEIPDSWKSFYFGYSLGITDIGDKIIVGEPAIRNLWYIPDQSQTADINWSISEFPFTGNAHVYENVTVLSGGATWTSNVSITSVIGTTGIGTSLDLNPTRVRWLDALGTSVDINRNGTRILAGAPGNYGTSNVTPIDTYMNRSTHAMSGRIYTLDWDPINAVWYEMGEVAKHIIAPKGQMMHGMCTRFDGSGRRIVTGCTGFTEVVATNKRGGVDVKGEVLVYDWNGDSWVNFPGENVEIVDRAWNASDHWTNWQWKTGESISIDGEGEMITFGVSEHKYPTAPTNGIFRPNAFNLTSVTYIGGATTSTAGSSSTVLTGSSNIWVYNIRQSMVVKGNVTVGGYVQATGMSIGTEDDSSTTTKSLFFGGSKSDNSYDLTVIENRVYDNDEKSELLIFKGAEGVDPTTGGGTFGPDRIRLKGGQIAFDLSSGYIRTQEDIRAVMHKNTGGACMLGIDVSAPTESIHVGGKIKCTRGFIGRGTEITGIDLNHVVNKGAEKFGNQAGITVSPIQLGEFTAGSETEFPPVAISWTSVWSSDYFINSSDDEQNAIVALDDSGSTYWNPPGYGYDGSYSGSTEKIPGYKGEWIEICSKSTGIGAIFVTKLEVNAVQSNMLPRRLYVFGSNDGIEYYLIHDTGDKGTGWGTNGTNTVFTRTPDIITEDSYDRILIIIESATGVLRIAEMILYGHSATLSLNMKIDNTGKIGIGTTSPVYPLDVNGIVNATSFRGTGPVSYFTVTVNGSTKFVIDGTQQQTITLYRGVTYRFDQADSSNGSHPFRISTTAEGSQYSSGSSSSYNGSNGSTGAYRQFIVPIDAPDTMYYNCSVHSGMGGTINILSGSVSTDGLVASNAFIQNNINVTGGLHANGSSGTSGHVLTSGGGGAMSWTSKFWSVGIDSHPTVAMTSASSGGYIASASSNSSGSAEYYAFNNVVGADGWMDGEWAYTGSPTGTYDGNSYTTYDTPSLYFPNSDSWGQWIQLQVPTSIIIYSIKIAPQNNRSANAPTEGKIFGSTNGSTWSLIHSFTGQTYTDGQYTTISFSNSDAYSYFRLSGERTGGGSGLGWQALIIGELKFNAMSTTNIGYNTGNVGIGTIGPAYKLDVNGDINMSTGSSLRINGVAQSFGGGSSVWSLNSTNAYYNSGNVGINTTSPARYLDVGGSISASSGGLLLRNGDTNVGVNDAPQLTFGFNGNNEYRHFIQTRHNSSSSMNAIDFYVCNGTQNNSLTSGVVHNLTLQSGNVGIGTTNPGYKLDVQGNINCTGTLSKGSGSFKIDHPLAIMSNTHNLYHSFIEGPQADLIYRGKVDLENGSASINLDTVSKMTSGTFDVLNRNVQCFTSNESDWDAVKGSVSGNTLTISCQNVSSTANVSWLVIGERKDKHMYDTSWTDDDGFVIPEQLK